MKKLWIPNIGVYTVNNSMDPNDPTQGNVTRASASPSHITAPDESTDYDHQRSAAALKFNVPAAKVAKDQTKIRDSEGEEAALTPDLEEVLQPTALCNLATVKQEHIEGEVVTKWQTTGEPTEIALQVFAHRFDYGKKKNSRLRAGSKLPSFLSTVALSGCQWCTT